MLDQAETGAYPTPIQHYFTLLLVLLDSSLGFSRSMREDVLKIGFQA